MLRKLIAFLLFVLAGLFSSLASARNVQRAECFPKNAGANWPIQAIYLHGLFPPSGADWYTALESYNRDWLEAYALKNHIRIAVPVARGTTNGRMGLKRNWLGENLPVIEADARRACGGAALAVPRALVGFSNGGNAVNRFSKLGCSKLREYSILLSIGAPESKGSRACEPETDYVREVVHHFPPRNAKLFSEVVATTKIKASYRGNASGFASGTRSGTR